nr:hypothetical protein [Brevibacterium luteolum]
MPGDVLKGADEHGVELRELRRVGSQQRRAQSVAGAVDDDVDAAGVDEVGDLPDPADRPVALSPAEIAAEHLADDPVAVHEPDGCGVEALEVAGDEDEPVAVGGELMGDRQPDAAGGTRDEGDRRLGRGGSGHGTRAGCRCHGHSISAHG